MPQHLPKMERKQTQRVARVFTAISLRKKENKDEVSLVDRLDISDWFLKWEHFGCRSEVCVYRVWRKSHDEKKNV